MYFYHLSLCCIINSIFIIIEMRYDEIVDEVNKVNTEFYHAVESLSMVKTMVKDDI